jgi:hypothetical protein
MDITITKQTNITILQPLMQDIVSFNALSGGAKTVIHMEDSAPQADQDKATSIVNQYATATIDAVGMDITCQLPDDTSADVYVYGSDDGLDASDTISVVAGVGSYTLDLVLPDTYTVVIFGNQSNKSGTIDIEVV